MVPEIKSSALRGDYSLMDADYVVSQNWRGITAEQHEVWRSLFARQSTLLPGRASSRFIECLQRLNVADGIPDFAVVNRLLQAATGWQLVAVPGLVPDLTFFTHLAHCRFPVTVWIREPHELDYIAEPDVFHDFFGHVPLLFDQIFADHLQAYGKGGLKALPHNGLSMLARLYWYTIEFGLIKEECGLRAYGAGILSSAGEIEYCLTSPVPLRLPFSVERVMRTGYKIDTYQEAYFVINSFAQLFHDTAADFLPLYERWCTVAPIEPSSLLPDDRLLGAT